MKTGDWNDETIEHWVITNIPLFQYSNAYISGALFRLAVDPS
jgi:hypothetical protein